MAFTKEQKREWRNRLDVQARQRQLAVAHTLKKKALGLPSHVPLDPKRRIDYVARRALQREQGMERLRQLIEAQKAAAAEYQPIKVARRRQKDRHYRASMRLAAIEAMGGACQWCGFDIEAALQFDHIRPLRRGMSGIRRNRETSDDIYRRVVQGKAEDIQLLCACCHVIKTKLIDDRDGQLSLNLARHEPALTLPLQIQGQ